MRSHLNYGPALALMAVVLAACASGGSSSTTGTAAARPTTSQQAMTGQLSPELLQWSGRFRPNRQVTGDVTATTRNDVGGTAKLTSAGQNSLRAQIDISLNGINVGDEPLHWSIAPGGCRSGAIPIVPLTSFPPIPVSTSSDHGTMDATIASPLPTTGQYHVNIFWHNGEDEGDVLACSELQLSTRK